MNVAKSEIVFLAEFAEPEIRRIVIHRSSVILYKQPVIINPLASQLYFSSSCSDLYALSKFITTFGNFKER